MEKRIQQRIREYRKQRGLTLRQLAEKAGCTQSYISQLEKGLTMPSLSMVGRLSAALDVKVVDLLSETGETDENHWLLRKGDRRRIVYPDGKVSSQMLVARVSKKRMEPLISTIEPGGDSDTAEGMCHPMGTEEFVLVLRGKVEFSIDGRRVPLCEGDTLYFEGNLPHQWRNKGRETAEVLFVFNPPTW
jgi:transcriptional regulator with XRE-family HTH domain